MPSDGGQEKTKAIQHHQLSHDSPFVGGCTQLGHAMNIKNQSQTSLGEMTITSSFIHDTLLTQNELDLVLF